MINQNPGEAVAECSDSNVRNKWVWVVQEIDHADTVVVLLRSSGIPFTSLVFELVPELLWLEALETSTFNVLQGTAWLRYLMVIKPVPSIPNRSWLKNDGARVEILGPKGKTGSEVQIILQFTLRGQAEVTFHLQCWPKSIYSATISFTWGVFKTRHFLTNKK